jgi:hypothetical protein
MDVVNQLQRATHEVRVAIERLEQAHALFSRSACHVDSYTVGQWDAAKPLAERLLLELESLAGAVVTELSEP